MQLLQLSGPLEFVAINILGPLTKPRQGKCFVIVMIDRYSGRNRVISTAGVTAPVVATIFVNHWIVSHEITNAVLTDNGSQFVSKAFAALCALVETRLVTTTEYHPKSKM